MLIKLSLSDISLFNKFYSPENGIPFITGPNKL